MAGIKVFGHPASTATRRVLIALHEKNVDFEFVHVELKDGEHKKEPFIFRNVSNICQNKILFHLDTEPLVWKILNVVLQPFGKVPAFEDGDFKLFGKQQNT